MAKQPLCCIWPSPMNNTVSVAASVPGRERTMSLELEKKALGPVKSAGARSSQSKGKEKGQGSESEIRKRENAKECLFIRRKEAHC